MNDLQIALIGAGAAVVVGVWGYNKWQERRHKALAEKVFRGSQADVLLGDEKEALADVDSVAPVAPAVPAARVGHDEPRERAEPVLAEIPPAETTVEPAAEAAGEPPATPPPLPEELADDVADCVIRIDFVEALPAPALWTAQSRWADKVGKPLSWIGFDDANGIWRRLSAHDARRYRTVHAALQLADRGGAVTDAGLSAFLDGVRDLAGQCVGVAELPKRDEVLMHARGLDEFCAGVDLQLGVNIVATGEPFVGTKLRGVAEAVDLKLAGDGFFHATDEAGRTRFTMSNIGAELFDADSLKSLAVQGITLSLDVPRVADGPAAFDALLLAARQLTEGLGGRLVDGQGHPLSDDMIATIRAKIDELQQTMAQHQIVAGGPRALRLFS